MGVILRSVSAIFLFALSHPALSETFSNPKVGGEYQLMGGANAARNAQQFCIENGFASGQSLGEMLIFGMGGADFNGFSWQFYNAPDGVRIPKIHNVECTRRQGDGGGGGGGGGGNVINNPNINGYLLMADNNGTNANRFCMERGHRGGRVLGTQWIARAPAVNFNGRGWEFFPQADNYNAVQSVQCHGGGGGGGGFPGQTYQRPLFNNYPILATAESADAYCRQQGFRRGQIQQTLYVDSNPCYHFANGRWQFSPNANRYQMIDVLACYRR